MSNEELHDLGASIEYASSLRTELNDKTARLLTIREGLADLIAKVDAALAEPISSADE